MTRDTRSEFHTLPASAPSRALALKEQNALAAVAPRLPAVSASRQEERDIFDPSLEDEPLDDISAEPEDEDEIAFEEDGAPGLEAGHFETLMKRDAAGLPALASAASDGLQLYLKEIAKFPMLKPGEDGELARRLRASNDSHAAFRLVSSHLRLVVKIAMDFQRRWMQNVLDLIQEGNIGLLRAVHKFDPDKGINFSYYASFWIKAYILKFIMDNWRLVKIGTTQAQRKLFYNLNKERQRLAAQGFDADAATLAKNLNVPEGQIIEMTQRMDGADISLDTPVGDDGGGSSHSTRLDFLPALAAGTEENVANAERDELIRDSLKTLVPTLSEKELDILYNRLLTDVPITLREIGEKYSISRERVRQLESRLLAKINVHLAKANPDFSEEWISP